jgi:LuxR family transcriptional regulator, maltose regulon positive regulatory protein
MAPERVVWLRPRSWGRAPLGHPPIRRERLFERLSRSPLGGVVLVCAPAGSGKSVLLQSWVEAEELGDFVAWVSVERGERDGQRFWLAVIDQLAQAVGEDRLVKHVSPAPRFSPRMVVEPLLPELQALEHPVVLVIDDLHELDAADGLECLQLFLERLPDQLRVVLGTRAEPGLALHRLRLAGLLTEIRGRDLSFSFEETRDFLEDAGIALPDDAVTKLHDRTEGWAAGLRLAALSLAHHRQPEQFVSEFCGGDRTIGDYLLAEVLDRQAPEGRELLLRTSVLDRVSGPLADVLTGGTGSERILQRLEDRNAFVTALDAGRTWFRYHELFADLLRLELRRTAPTIIGSLHRAAAQWYEEHACVVEAIRHAQAAGDWAWACRLLVEHYLDLTLDGRAATIHALLAAFPPDVRADDAELALASTGAAIMDGRPDAAEVYLRHAEALTTTVPEERRRRFDLGTAGMRVWLACWQGDPEAVSQAMRSLQAALAAPTPQELALDNDVHAMALLNLGTAELWAAKLDDACTDLERALALARRIRRPYLQIGALAHLGLASVLNGSHISVMLQLADEAVAVGECNGWSEHPVLGSPLAARAKAYVWLGRFADAERSLDRAEHALSNDSEPSLVFLLNYGRGLLYSAQGRLEDALAAFRVAEGAQRLLAAEHTLAAELQSRLVQTQVALGDIGGARAVLSGLDARSRDQPRGLVPGVVDRPGGPLTVMRVAEAVIDLAEGSPREALAVLAPALERDEAPVRLSWPRIQALLCDAVAREQLGDARAAADSLERALELAAPERIVLPFVLPPARELVMHHPRHRTAHPELLAAIQGVLAGCSAPRRGQTAPPLDELSPAELRVLSYLPSDLTAGEIASELYLSANTVRTHLRHIYAKLDAHTRRQAIVRARELGLLGPR